MNRAVLAAPIALWLASPATYAALITFDPPHAEVEASASPNNLAFDVTVATSLFSPISYLDVLFASKSLRFVGWQFCAGCDFDYTTVEPVGLYPNDLYVNFLSLRQIAYPIPFTFGRLTVDAGGLAPGDYSIFVEDPSFCDPGKCPDPPQGIATVRVTPEPSAAALLLVGLASAGALRFGIRRT